MTDKEALLLALEALEGFYEYGYDRQECFEHITAIEEVLAEHAMREVQRLGQEIEQEPVFTYEQVKAHIQVAMMSTTPPQRKPLTKEEMFEAIRPLYSSEMSARIAVDYSEDEYRAIEAAHGIKE